jgi:hypothetical protein
MVAPSRESPVDRVLADRLVAEIKKLIAGRSVEEAVALLTFVNHAISQVEAADDRR